MLDFSNGAATGWSESINDPPAAQGQMKATSPSKALGYPQRPSQLLLSTARQPRFVDIGSEECWWRESGRWQGRETAGGRYGERVGRRKRGYEAF